MIYPKFSNDIKNAEMVNDNNNSNNSNSIQHNNANVRHDSVISYDVLKAPTLVGQLETELQRAVDAYRTNLVQNMTQNIIKPKAVESPIGTLATTVDNIGKTANEAIKEANPGMLASALSALGGLFGLGGSKPSRDDDGDAANVQSVSGQKYMHTLTTDRDNFVIVSTMILKSLTAAIDGKPLPPRFYNDLNYLIGNPFMPTPAAGLTKAIQDNLGYSTKSIMYTSFRRALTWVGSAFDRFLQKRMAYKSDVDNLSATYDDAMSADLDRFDFDLDNFGGLNNHE